VVLVAGAWVPLLVHDVEPRDVTALPIAPSLVVLTREGPPDVDRVSLLEFHTSDTMKWALHTLTATFASSVKVRTSPLARKP
jgi:hypothetical protein